MRKFSTLFCVGAVAVGVSSCSADSVVKGDVIPLESYHITNQVLTFKAQSTGCTQNNYFVIRTDKIDDDKAVLSVLQTKQDRCRRMPFFDTFSLPLRNELLEKKIKLTNPKAAPIVKRTK